MTRPRDGAYREVLAEHVGVPVRMPEPRPLRSEDFAPPCPEPPLRDGTLPGPPVVPVLISIETREDVIKRLHLSRVAEKAAEAAKKRTDREQGRWQNAAQALREWARYMGDGVEAGSYSRMLAREIDLHRGGIQERADPIWLNQTAGHRIVIVGRALAAAFPDPFVVQRAMGETHIPAALCRTALVMRIQGERIVTTLDRAQKGNAPGEKRRNVKGTVWRVVPAKTVERDERDEDGEVHVERVIGVAERLSAELQRDVTVGDVAAIVRHGLAEMTRVLSAAGLVPEARRRREASEDMASNDPDVLHGEKAIAQHCGLESVSSVREWRTKYGMPVHTTPSGRVWARKSEIDPWLKDRDAWVKRLAGAQ